TDRALVLLEEYCKKLRKPEEQQLKKAIRKTFNIHSTIENKAMSNSTGFLIKLLVLRKCKWRICLTVTFLRMFGNTTSYVKRISIEEEKDGDNLIASKRKQPDMELPPTLHCQRLLHVMSLDTQEISQSHPPGPCHRDQGHFSICKLKLMLSESEENKLKKRPILEHPGHKTDFGNITGDRWESCHYSWHWQSCCYGDYDAFFDCNSYREFNETMWPFTAAQGLSLVPHQRKALYHCSLLWMCGTEKIG
ncbi:hypothetical protein EK904_014864, partial [Melospiza melodia maxima]